MISIIVFTILFIVLIIISVPIGFALGISGLVAFIITGSPLSLFAQRLWTGLDSFSLIAIPFFILAGELMGGSGILTRLLDLAKLLVGRFKGGLLYINTLVSMLFGGINGSAVADASAVGSMLIPATKEEYNDPDLAAAVTASGSVVGPIIPPSLPMLIYAFAATNVSVAALFMAGIVPGILLGLGMMLVTFFIAKKRDLKANNEAYTFKEAMRVIRRAIIPAILPLIMVIGIVAGIMTPTEAGAIGVVYALFIGFFVTKELTLKSFYDSLIRSVNVTAIVMIMISVGNVVTWWLTTQNVPQIISSFMQNTTTNATVFILLMFVFYLFIGLFIEQAAAMIMLVPIFAPLATMYGIDPIHFGLFTVLSLALGLLTPPVGICLFITSSIAGSPIERVFKAGAPYLISMAIVTLMVTLFPQIYLWVPKMFGL